MSLGRCMPGAARAESLCWRVLVPSAFHTLVTVVEVEMSCVCSRLSALCAEVGEVPAWPEPSGPQLG